jgi:hypothetical protein
MGVLVITEQSRRAIESLMPTESEVVHNLIKSCTTTFDRSRPMFAVIQDLVVGEGNAVCAFGVDDCGGHYSGLREAIYRIQSSWADGAVDPSVDMPYLETKGSRDDPDIRFDEYEDLAYGWMTCESDRPGAEIDYWFCKGCYDFSVRVNGLIIPYVMEEVL